MNMYSIISWKQKNRFIMRTFGCIQSKLRVIKHNPTMITPSKWDFNRIRYIVQCGCSFSIFYWLNITIH